jgi:hypothetical protein
MAGHGWLCSYNLSRGQDIEDSVTKFFDTWDLMLVLGNRNGKRANLRFAVEITGYQRQLKRAIEKEMRARQRYAHIEPIQDKRNKEDVINQSFTHVARIRSTTALRRIQSSSPTLLVTPKSPMMT